MISLYYEGANMKDFMCRLPEDIHKDLKKMSFFTNESMSLIVRKALDAYLRSNLQKVTEEDCCASQFYGSIEPILSKIWDNPDDDIYNDL